MKLHTYRITGHEFAFPVNPFTVVASTKLEARKLVRLLHPDLGIDSIERLPDVKTRLAKLTTDRTVASFDLPADLTNRTIRDLATYVYRDCRLRQVKVPFGAVPYLDAMHSMTTIDDAYGADDGRSIVAYALSNLTGWRGVVAKAVKAELNRRLKAPAASKSRADIDAANVQVMDAFRKSLNNPT